MLALTPREMFKVDAADRDDVKMDFGNRLNAAHEGEAT